jgi:hypothetical protein
MVGLSGLNLLDVQSGNAAPNATRNDFTLVLRERVGPYRYWRTLKEGSAYARALASFGAPTATGKDAPNSNLCTVRWESIGLDIGFAGGRGDCTKRGLRRAAWYGMRLWGERWRTARGLRIGDPLERVHELYPNARYVSRPPEPGEWWLVTGPHEEGGRRPLLVAEVSAGRLVAIRVPAGYVF